MNQCLGMSTIVVHDYDIAIEFFIEKLMFRLVEDTKIEHEDKRWVVVAPTGSQESALLLAKASGTRQKQMVGEQTGGRVAFFLNTDDFWRDYDAYKSRGVRFIKEPVKENYGTVAVFEDVCGNFWDLLEPN